MDVDPGAVGLIPPQDWQQTLGLVIQLLQAQQAQMEELGRVRTKKANTHMMLLM